MKQFIAFSFTDNTIVMEKETTLLRLSMETQNGC